MNTNKVLEFIGSKWFVAILALVMIFLLPTTYSNFMVVFKGGAMARLWYVPTVFLMNLLAAIMACYKATGMFFTKNRDDQAEWDE